MVRIVPSGPILIEGPVELVHDGETVRSDRFIVAVCTCRRSHTYPLCDTSHRRRIRTARDEPDDDADDEDDEAGDDA
ncbi:CDGSH iron-sulfur domain-containing protein [Actinopolymorpha singaporensis]|uniref:Iron-binding zinc finger CDGSH type n=1 Tax=Actinopolymorpha singaporensis TaxID=117157 RepID=A0A1H1TMD8_9ACTN|nr:CDGSH iron-sulfur domain-containing protein [Actinopolymorpha singaporensis]SDS61398.1 Iron-binding zinc finger CDGSH type [Actinopolymorpha singaporensis]